MTESRKCILFKATLVLEKQSAISWIELGVHSFSSDTRGHGKASQQEPEDHKFVLAGLAGGMLACLEAYSPPSRASATPFLSIKSMIN